MNSNSGSNPGEPKNEEMFEKLNNLFQLELKEFTNGLRGLQKKESEANEEKGVSVIKFVRYFVTWDEDNKKPWAPLFLSSISIKKSGKYKLTISNEFEINQVLIEYFKNENAILPSADLEEKFISEIININQFDEAIALFENHYKSEGVVGLKIKDRSLIGYFDYSNLPMVSDLGSEEFEELISEHELGEAIAAVDQEKIDKKILDDYSVGPFPEFKEIDKIIPSKEFLALDADSSQQLPILAAGKDFHLVIQGPPGTGKSQTIANMISYCASLEEPKKILFVSEKRAAIDAVLKRLNQNNLDFLILDVFKGLKPAKKREIYEELSTLIADGVPIHDSRNSKILDNKLHEVRKKLNSYSTKTDQDTFQDLEILNSSDKPTFSGGIDDYAYFLSEIDSDEVEDLINEISAEESKVSTEEKVDSLISAILTRNKILENKEVDIEFFEKYLLLNENFQTLGDFEDLLQQFKNISKLGEPKNEEMFEKLNNLFQLELKDFKKINELLTIALELNKVLNVFKAEIFSEDLERVFEEIDQYKKVNNKNAEAKLKETKAELFGLLKPFQLKNFFITKKTIEANARNVISAKNILNKYKFDFTKIDELTIASAEITNVFSELETSKEMIETNTNLKIDEFKSINELVKEIDIILKSTIVKDLSSLAKEYKTIEELNFNFYRIFDKGTKKNLEFIVKAILLKILLNGIYNDNFSETSEIQNESVENFMILDKHERVLQNIEQIKLKYTHNLEDAKLKYPDQLSKIKKEANKKRSQANFRKILDDAQDLMLGVKPCWVMSPLVASQVLPRKQIFDIVIFDEASQVTTPSAITAIGRGKTLVVAGDSNQLPPTDFFKTQLDEEFASETQDFSSILDVMEILIPSKGINDLEFHYRSKDERLITVSNKFMKYNLRTIPGLGNLEAIKFIKVDTKSDAEKGSNPDEVRAVCNEISDHMENNPEKSLVVITFGSDHMKYIEELFAKEYEELPHVASYIESWENTVEPFRIKNLETVQGDERDYVILSIGYGKRQGKLRYNFGPINKENGDRRLNVAASRAKESMTIISTITHEDLLDSKLNSKGPIMFKTLLKYFQLESEAPDEEKGIIGLQAFTNNLLVNKPPMNSIEKQIKRSIERLGYIVEPQFGASNYFIDFVIAEKSKPGKWLLAVEFDGASYHSSRTARDRDRLRQRNLEYFGWKFYRIWSTDWFNNKKKVLEDLDIELKKRIKEG